MDILFSTPKFASDPHTGTLSLLATQLNERSHSVTGIQEPGGIETDVFPITELPAPSVTSPWWIRLWRYYDRWQESVASYLTEHQPDVIVSDRRTHVPTLLGAQSGEIPVVAIIEGLGFMRYAPKQFGPSKHLSFSSLPWSSRLQYPFVRSLFRQQRNAFPEFEAVVTLSGFLSDTVTETFGVDSTLIPTMVDLDRVRAESFDQSAVTMINPRSELKGSDIFIDIASRLSDIDFLVAGEFASSGNRRAIESLPNVTHLGWVDDMSTVYARTAVLLVPSLVEEGGPRVISEALANGIPVVGTDRGGIPCFVDDAGAIVEDPYDIEDWEQKIRTTLDRRDCLSDRATELSSRFDSETASNRYEDLLRSIVDSERPTE